MGFMVRGGSDRLGSHESVRFCTDASPSIGQVTGRLTLYAYIDEAGQRSRSASSSDHFVMSAVVMMEPGLAASAAMLATLRQELGRRPGDTLHWRNIKHHSQKLHVALTIGRADYLRVCSVVVCKRHLTMSSTMNDDQAYLYTVRYLLERLSWLARDSGAELEYTLAHVVRFKLSKLREYENILRVDPRCQIAWSHVNPRGGRIDQPSRVEYLQLADAVASATFAAVEVDSFGNTERRYLESFSDRLWRRGTNNNALTSYGLKFHPWSDATKAAYPWVAAL